MGTARSAALSLLDRPINKETPLGSLAGGITPLSDVFVRNHFDMPRGIEPAQWRLVVEGDVHSPLSLTLEDLQSGPRVRLPVTLECAGNGRRLIEPTPPGVPWGFGAVSTVEVVGTPLAAVLQRAGLKSSAKEILCVGRDGGYLPSGRLAAFERSLPCETALAEHVLLVWEMNGAPLVPIHGAPLRLIVPGWYAMASVKWLARLVALTSPFEGYFQREEYVYRRPGERDAPVTTMRVRSLFARPLDGEEVAMAPIDLMGPAWSGDGGIRRVEVTTDAGESWRTVELSSGPSSQAASHWWTRWIPPAPGRYVLGVRAEDETGARQPDSSAWNELGYGNNAIQWIRVHAR